MKTLILLTHENYPASKANRALLESLPEGAPVVVRNLYEKYPDGRIDDAAEQSLAEQFDRIIFQYPMYWYDVPAFFKKWLDEVLAFGWAFGTREALRGKSIGLVITTGSPRETFTREQAGFTIEESALPVIATIRYVKAEYAGLVALCNGDNLDPAEVAESRAAYQRLVLGA